MLVTAYYRLTVNSVGRFFLFCFFYGRLTITVAVRLGNGKPHRLPSVTAVAIAPIVAVAIGSCQIEPLAFSTHRQKCFPRPRGSI